MGCIFSMEVDVPDEVLPAPDPNAGHTFFCKNISMMSKDYVVWHGGCGEDEGGKLWMVVDQEGKWWDGNMVTTLETFQRDSSNPDLKGQDGKIGSGETVVSCIMDKLDGDNYIFSDYEAHVDSDDSDYTTMSVSIPSLKNPNSSHDWQGSTPVKRCSCHGIEETMACLGLGGRRR